MHRKRHRDDQCRKYELSRYAGARSQSYILLICRLGRLFTSNVSVFFVEFYKLFLGLAAIQSVLPR
jgi:hypothetical protein